jgi:hypothetical protein
VICKLSNLISFCCKFHFMFHISSSGLLIRVIVYGRDLPEHTQANKEAHVLGYRVPDGYVFPRRGHGPRRCIAATRQAPAEVAEQRPQPAAALLALAMRRHHRRPDSCGLAAVVAALSSSPHFSALPTSPSRQRWPQRRCPRSTTSQQR